MIQKSTTQCTQVRSHSVSHISLSAYLQKTNRTPNSTKIPKLQRPGIRCPTNTSQTPDPFSNLTPHSPTNSKNSTLPPLSTFAHTANGTCTRLPSSPLSHLAFPNTATSSLPPPAPNAVSTSNSSPVRCRRMSASVCAMASGPVCAVLLWRRWRRAESGRLLGVRVSWREIGWGRGRDEPVRAEEGCVGGCEGGDGGGGGVWVG